ncbi:hypothetical protein EJ05DRAFT_513477 [Pseudovirgaria hyperparasitica]|uniref:Uncharacterized protein n=1 Tax=Pseudovirgaria hyperparasitica TaxID=470096 RepID=A0A6A6VX45_9PEZI|nr:uncharacterized protein EJ05DRAFT_513477 [Pseudovirgaria hyperparasitica]KAF2755172.1 hypothetical protein EJ05DRAFT_513477 [Pseudovirgaria hyperparasitica]
MASTSDHHRDLTWEDIKDRLPGIICKKEQAASMKGHHLSYSRVRELFEEAHKIFISLKGEGYQGDHLVNLWTLEINMKVICYKPEILQIVWEEPEFDEALGYWQKHHFQARATYRWTHLQSWEPVRKDLRKQKRISKLRVWLTGLHTDSEVKKGSEMVRVDSGVST